MKKITLVVLTMAFLAMGASQAMAASFDVTSNFGILIPQEATCDDIGDVLIEPKPSTGSMWSPVAPGVPQIITVQLLLADTVCVTDTTPEPFDYDCYYLWNDGEQLAALVGVAGGSVPDAWDYRVYCNDGDDHILVEINAENGTFGSSPPADVAGKIAMFQRDEANFASNSLIAAPCAQYTTMCLNIEPSPYNKDQFGANRVEVSYSDVTGNSYTGDVYVATIGSTGAACTIDMEPCLKDLVNLPNLDYGFETIELVKIYESEDQQATQCRPGPPGEICFRVDQPTGSKAFGDLVNMVNLVHDWDITVTENPSYPNLWPCYVTVYDKDGNNLGGTILASSVIPNTGNSITIEGVTVDAANDLPLQVQVGFCYNCDANIGDLSVEVQFNKVGAACGSDCPQLSAGPMRVAEVVEATGMKIQAIFPYGPVPGAGGWWVGMSLCNLVDHDLEVSLQVFEEDGDEYYTPNKVVIPARAMRTGLFLGADLVLNGVPVGLKTDSADTSFGDERFWVLATVNVQVMGILNNPADTLTGMPAFTGFLMMGDGAQAQGYLPQGINWLPAVLTENSAMINSLLP